MLNNIAGFGVHDTDVGRLIRGKKAALMIEWIDINAYGIRRVGYDASIKRMYIDFVDSDDIGVYCKIPESLFREFISAELVGHFYIQHIRNKFGC